MRSALLLLVLAVVAAAQSVGVGRMLEQSGQYDRALEEYRLALEVRPEDAGAYEGFRRVSLAVGRADSLVVLSGRLAARFPNDSRYALGRAEGLLALKRVREAVEVLNQVAARWPNQVVAAVDLLERAGALDEAVELARAERDRSRDRTYWAGRLADLYERTGRPLDAARELVEMVNARPEMHRELLPRFREHATRVDRRRLLAVVREIEDQWARARVEAEVLLATGRDAEALAAVRSVMDRDGLYGFGHEAEDGGAFNAALAVYQELGLPSEQARVLRKLGRTREARAALEKSDSPEARFELAQLLRLEERDQPAAIRAYRQVLERRPRDDNARYGLAASLAANGDLAGALAVLAEVRSPADSVRLLDARVLFYAGEFDSCRARAMELASKSPSSPLVNDALELALLSRAGERVGELARAMMALETGRHDSALAIARRLEQGRDDAAENAWFVAAEALADAGQARQALNELDRFVEQYPQSRRRARARFVQASVLRDRVGDENKYREVLERLIVEDPSSSYAAVARALLDEAGRPVDPGDIR